MFDVKKYGEMTKHYESLTKDDIRRAVVACGGRCGYTKFFLGEYVLQVHNAADEKDDFVAELIMLPSR